MTAQLEVGAGNMGGFTTNYLAENGRRIPIIGKLYINGSIQFLGIPDFFGGNGLSFIKNLKSPTDSTGWGHGDTSNKNWGVMPGGAYINATVSWGTNILAHPAYIYRILVDPCTAACRVHDDLLCHRRCDRMRSPTTSLNPGVNLSIHRCDDNQESPVTQYIYFQNSVATFCNLHFLPITIVSNCLQITCSITFCVIRVR